MSDLANNAPASPASPAPATGALPSMAGRTILQVIPDLDTGGAERTVLEVTEAIRAAGGRSLVASRGGRMVGDLVALGGELIEMNTATKNPLILRANAARLAELVAARGIDLIHARSRAPAWSALWAARRTDTAFVTTYHGAYSGRSRAKRFYNSVMARGDRVIANSDWTAHHIRTTHGTTPKRIVTVARGVDLMSFDPDAVSTARIEAVRRDWGLDSGSPGLVILLPGRLTDWKGQRLALAALAELSQEERKGLLLILAGDAQGRDGYLETLRADIETLGLGTQVRIPGHCSDMPAACRAADIVLTPSTRPEAFGRAAAEASAMGRAVIAADHGGARETVIDGQTGVRFMPGDKGALAVAIRMLIGLGDRGRAGLGEAGRVHIVEHFSKRNLQTATLKVYADLIDTP